MRGVNEDELQLTDETINDLGGDNFDIIYVQSIFLMRTNSTSLRTLTNYLELQ